jgi:Dolichyl-phosphate-mannose-protein mannosyltransferase
LEVPSTTNPSSTERLAAFTRRHWDDIAFVVVLVALNAFARWVRLEPIENGGDPLDAWYFVRQLAHENHPKTAWLDHHAARFGMHWITWIVQHLFGTHPRYYYLPQLFASCSCVALTYLLGRQLHGKLTGVLAALWLMEFPLFNSASSQLRRGIFEAMYALAALNCLVRYLDQTDERGQRRWLAACAVATFFAYLVELPSLYITPGVALVVWLARRNLRHIVLYGGILAALFAVETTLYFTLTHYSSRIAVVSAAHLSQKLRGSEGEGVPFSYLLERFTKAKDGTKLVFYPFFFAAPLLVWRGGPKARAVALGAGSFLFFITFLVRGIDPIRVFELNGDRYLLLGVPLAIVANTVCFVWLIEALGLVRRLDGLLATGRDRPWAASVLLGVALAAVTAELAREAWDERRVPHALAGVERAYLLLNDTFERGLPIIADVSKKDGPPAGWQSRGLHWTEKGFIRDELLLDGRRLPDFGYSTSIAMLDRTHRYVPKNLTPERARELETDGCAVKLRSRGPFMEFSPNLDRLPARCAP